MKKRILSIAVSLCTVLSLFPVSAYAEEFHTPESLYSNVGESVSGNQSIGNSAQNTTSQENNTLTAVEKVQALLNALPDADTITEENRADVEDLLTAIDDAKFPLEDEERDALDFTRYNAAIAALNVLDNMEGAYIPAVAEASSYFSFDKTTGTITGVTDKTGKIIIPTIIDGVAVVSIGDSAFRSCSNLINITIPNSVTSIGENAFSNCQNLINITIPNSVTSIGDGAFDGCTGLLHVSYLGTQEEWNTLKLSIGDNNNVITEKAICFPITYKIPSNFVYDGKEKIFTVIKPDNLSIKGTDCDGNFMSFSNKVIYAGDKYSYYIDTENGYWVYIIEYIITPATPTADHFDFTPPSDLTYDGNSKSATVSWKTAMAIDGSSLGEITVKYYDENGKLLDGKPKNVGTYSVKVDVIKSRDNFAATNLTTDSWKFSIKDKLKSITPQTMNAVPSGTSYEAMNLPATVDIETAAGKVLKADVTWDTKKPKSGSYSPYELKEQNVVLNGTVTCPEEIDVSGVALTTTLTIRINAADYVENVTADHSTETVYDSNQKIHLTTNTSGATIYYTLDGSTPTRESTKYTGEISINGAEAQSITTTIKAIAVKEGMQDSAIQTFSYTIQIPDKTPPTGKITLGTNTWSTFFNNITFGLFFKDTQEVTITANDNSGDTVTIKYLLSDKELTIEELATATFNVYNDKFTVKPNNKNVIYAKLSDNSGNVAYINSNGIVLDNVVPVIAGITNGKTYCEAQTITVSDKYDVSVSVNGTPVTLDANGQFTLSPASGKQTVVATDKAGNVSEMIVTVNDGHEGGTATCSKKSICAYCGEEYGSLDSNNHKGGTEIKNDKAVTCTEDGYTGDTYCKDCDTKLQDGIPITKLGHTDANKDHICDVETCKAIIGSCSGGDAATCSQKSICAYCGKEYGSLNENNHTLKHYQKNAPTETTTGNKEYWQCGGCSKIFLDQYGMNPVEFKDIKRNLPKITDGTGQSLNAGENKELSFRSNADFDEFIRVDLDGKTVDANNYTKREGSTIITLNAGYVASLPKGEHTISIVSEFGTASTTFTVLEASTPTNEPASTPANEPIVTKAAEKTSPATGDGNNIALWITLLLLGGLCMGAGICGKKSNNKTL